MSRKINVMNDATRGFTPQLTFVDDGAGAVAACDQFGLYGLGESRGDAVGAWHHEAERTLTMMESEPLHPVLFRQRQFLRAVVRPFVDPQEAKPNGN